MTAAIRPKERAPAFYALIVLLFYLPATAAANVWQSTFGQASFQETRSSAGEILAGTEWESSLSPGTTYTIRFDVRSLQGEMALLVGNNPPIPINKPGSYSFDFNVSSSGERQLLFRSAGSNVTADVSDISVTPSWDAATTSLQTASTGGGLPRGHYVAYDRMRNLKEELAMANRSSYHRTVAGEINSALTTPGIKGFWMRFNWRELEVGDGRFNWAVADANMEVARRYGKRFIIAITDRSFDGTNPMPKYFPGQYVLPSGSGGGSGYVSKRWDPWVYNRLIRLHKAIASRYSGSANFGGIATSETALDVRSGDYSIAKFRQALTQVVNQTQPALRNGKLLLYMNFLQGGDSSDMRKDARVALLRDVPHGRLAIGGPDITPDSFGMPRSASAYRIHARKTMPGLSQFCHLQHVDQGFRGINVKSNKARLAYIEEIRKKRQQETQHWYNGPKAVFEFDSLPASTGAGPVPLHPQHALGKLWRPDELFQFSRRNFNCAYVVWHYRERPPASEFSWKDIRPVILNNQYF